MGLPESLQLFDETPVKGATKKISRRFRGSQVCRGLAAGGSRIRTPSPALRKPSTRNRWFARLFAGAGSQERTGLWSSDSLVAGKNTGNLTRIARRSLDTGSKTKELLDKFPSAETENSSTAQQPIDIPHHGVFYSHQGKLLAERQTQPGSTMKR